MSRLFKGFTLNEGYTDLGTLSVDITFVESASQPNAFVSNEPKGNTSVLFKLVNDDTNDPLKGLQVNFTVDAPVGTDRAITSEQFSNAEGFVEFVIPQIATYPISSTEVNIIDYEIIGQLEDRQHECYLQVRDGSDDPFYTLYRQFAIEIDGASGLLGVQDAEGTSIYTLYPEITITSGMTAIFISGTGQVYGYTDSTDTWALIETIEFTQFSNPAGLTFSKDWFYETSGTSGSLTTGELGDGSFSDFSFVGFNASPVLIDIEVEIPDPEGGDPLYDDILQLLPGDPNIHILELDYVPAAPDDETPTIADVATAAGISFSGPFTTFLTANDLDTVQAIRRAGPLKYMAGIPDPDASEVALLQSYVDLYFLTYDIDLVTDLRGAGYHTVYSIAMVTRNSFIADMTAGDSDVFSLARFHQLAVTRVSLVSNVLAASLNDQQLVVKMNYAGDNPKAYEIFAPSCGCDDCKSGLSPFAYLSDLIKYSAAHVEKTDAYEPVDYTEFLNLIQSTFYQNVGTFLVDCDTLHDEYCRVRLATEVLLKLKEFLEEGISPARLAVFDTEYNQYLQLTYNNLLLQAGTSFDEVRSVFIAGDNKPELSAKLASKLVIPYYVPETSDLTTDKLWLSLNGSGDNELTEARLQIVFGFRNVSEDVLTPTPEGLVKEWKEDYLKSIWIDEDYPMSAYTRQGITSTSTPTIKDEWKPIIDPDIIGISDMSYFVSDDVLAIYRYRKSYIDTLLDYYVKDTSNLLSRTSADMTNRIVRSPEDVGGDIVYADTVYFDVSSVEESFTLLSKVTNGTNVDFYLETISQPDGSSPTMRYRRLQDVLSNSSPAAHQLTVVLQNSASDYLASGYVKLISTVPGQTNVYSTDAGDTHYKINSIDVSGGATVIITFHNDVSFPIYPVMEGLDLIYEKEVELFTDIIPYPTNDDDSDGLVPDLFSNDSQTYIRFGGGASFNYDVWSSSEWGVNPPDVDATYAGLKLVYSQIQSGNVSAYSSIIFNGLHLTVAQFSRMMVLFIKCENYLAAMYTNPRPTIEELYELASIFCISTKTPLRPVWVTEEINYGTTDLDLHLTKVNFWKSLTEPLTSIWNPILQTTDVKPIIDPEFISLENIVEGPYGTDYRNLFNNRLVTLSDAKDVILNVLIPYDSNSAHGFTYVFNYMNTGDTGTAYTIPAPYADLDDLIAAVRSLNVFVSRDATGTMTETFGLTKTEFLNLVDIRDAYYAVGYLVNPTTLAQLSVAADIAVLGYKRHWLFFGSTIETWIEEEEALTYHQYYDILKMYLDPVRGNKDERKVWVETLEAWNKTPIIDPDIVPVENIKNFVAGDPAYDFWNERTIDYDDKINGTGGYATVFNPEDSASDQFDGFVTLICSEIFGEDTLIPTSTIDYFLELQTREESGENIQPRVERLNLTMSDYRFLRKIYDLLEPLGTVTLIGTEYEDAYDIFLQAYKQQQLFYTYRLEEYQELFVAPDPVPAGYPILLSSVEFQDYHAPINIFPLTALPVFNTRRSPHAIRRNWLDILISRTDKTNEINAEWKSVLENTEDTTMPAYRNALVKALSNDCETFDQAADRLAKSLFIETKDNCCVKHSRVSQAIETMQGFLFALRNGVYDEYLDGFSLHDSAFDQQWQWLGSYATWRSAMLVFLYPENILYPSLKRNQSPAFQQLNRAMQDSSRISPESACLAAKNYEDYFIDVMNLDIKFTANTKTYVYKTKVDVCCEEGLSYERVDFLFAQSTSTQKSYWALKLPGDSDYALSFWDALDLPEQAKLVGAYPIGRDYDESDVPRRRELWLFYSYRKDGNLKLAYIKKDLQIANAAWTDGVDVDIPTKLPADGGGTHDFGAPFAITACQCSVEWDWMSFIFSYYRNGGGAYHIHLRFFDNHQEFDLNVKSFPSAGNLYYHFDQNAHPPITAIRHSTADSSSTDVGQLFGLSIIFESQVTSVNFNVNDSGTNTHTVSFPALAEIIGVFQKRNDPNVLIAVYKEDGATSVTIKKITFTSADAGGIITSESTYNASSDFDNFSKIRPIFTQNNGVGPHFGVVSIDNAQLASKLLLVGSDYTAEDLYNLIPVTMTGTNPVRIQSGHCVEDFLDRKSGIEAMMNINIQTPTDFFHKTSLSMEYLYEAYYFVPMLVALDQQKRGQFESALDWYRTVYDYTQNLATNRKIFYGLVLEETLANVFDRPIDWLLDPLNPHQIAQTRANAYSRYTVMNIAQCLTAFGDREFTMDTTETVPRARQLYTAALDLLQLNELNVRPNGCVAEAYCFPASITQNIVGTLWVNLFERMNAELAGISDQTVLDDTRDDIIDIFEDEGTTMSEKFAAAFDAIATAKEGLITIPPSVGEVIGGAADRITLALQFLEAPEYFGGSTDNYMTQFSDSFDLAMSNISGIPVNSLNSGTFNNSVLQLSDADPSLASSYAFRFMNDSGVQQLTNEDAFNPLHPTGVARQSNMEFTNTVPFLFANTDVNIGYIPLIDYEFCIPINPVYGSLQMKLNVELYKIFNCRNIGGMQRELEIYTAPTDSTSNIPVIGAQGSITFPSLNSFMPSQYRFAVLIERAKQIIQQTQQIESQFLAAMEKRDAEYYNLMKARQDLQTANSTVQLQNLRIKQANDEKRVADLQLNRAQVSQNTFDNWISAGLNFYEIASLTFLSNAIVLDFVASGAYFASTGPLNAAGAGQGLSQLSQASSQLSALFSQTASYERRNQEWHYQLQVANVDVSIANQQIKVSDDNVRVVSQEREIAQLNVDHANDTLEFLKNKFTNAELYDWMSNVLQGVYAYMLNLSTATAKIAENQLHFERQEPVGPFIQDDYWENTTGSFANSVTGDGKNDRLGLTGSARLLQDILRLDQFAFDTRKRKLQITKNISLAQNFPEAFQQFRETGILNFELTDQMFNYDFPGHYLRLISSVKTSLIGLVPVYGGIKATLTADPISYTVIGGNNFQKIPINRVHRDIVALSSPSNATGLFDLTQLNTELLNPFEAMGVESKWEFKLPHFSNRMDYDSIADVIISVDYTALDSADYRSFVLSDIENQFSFSRAFSFKNNFPDQWYELGNVLEGVSEFEVTFQTRKADFPAGLNSMEASRLILYFVRESGFVNEITFDNFSLSDADGFDGTTVNGIFNADAMLQASSDPSSPLAPYQTWKLKFNNSDDVNRLLFLNEDITDILFVITCDAELPGYV
jgi:hypothetical protein